jgi:hypothetical protein
MDSGVLSTILRTFGMPYIHKILLFASSVSNIQCAKPLRFQLRLATKSLGLITKILKEAGIM